MGCGMTGLPGFEEGSFMVLRKVSFIAGYPTDPRCIEEKMGRLKGYKGKKKKMGRRPTSVKKPPRFPPSFTPVNLRGVPRAKKAQRSFLPSGFASRLSGRSSLTAWMTKPARTRFAARAARAAA